MKNKTEKDLRRQIRKAAFRLFLEKGYDETTTREIAEAAGIERGHLYYYYPKKEDMLFDWYRDFLLRIAALIHKVHPEETDGYVLITLADLIYYRAIFMDEALLRLFSTILGNRNLTKIKIKTTCEIDWQILSDNQKRQMKARNQFIGMCKVIGSEVELFLSMQSGEIDMTQEEFTGHILDLQMDYFPVSASSRAKVRQTALSEFTDFSNHQIRSLLM